MPEVWHGARLEGERNRCVAANRRQFAAHFRLIRPCDELFAKFALHFARMSEDVVQRPILVQQTHGGFVADAGDAGDVVAAVSRQPLPVHHLLRREAIHFVHHGGCKVRRFADALAGEQHLRCIGHQLERIAVAGQDDGADPGVLTQFGQRAEKIVRLPALQGENLDAHFRQQRPNGGELLAQFIRRCGASRFVVRICRVAERRRVFIEADREIAGVFV